MPSLYLRVITKQKNRCQGNHAENELLRSRHHHSALTCVAQKRRERRADSLQPWHISAAAAPTTPPPPLPPARQTRGKTASDDQLTGRCPPLLTGGRAVATLGRSSPPNPPPLTTRRKHPSTLGRRLPLWASLHSPGLCLHTAALLLILVLSNLRNSVHSLHSPHPSTHIHTQQYLD